MEKIFNTSLNLWRLDKSPSIADRPFEGVLHKATEHDIDVIAAMHRDEKLVRERIDSGNLAYWIEIDGKCAHVTWFAVGTYFVWDIRCDVLLPPGSLYSFDAFTPPEFRRRGFGPLCMLNAFESGQTGNSQPIYLLVRTDNAAGNGTVLKMGFERIAVASLAQLPPLRRYMLLLSSGEKRKRIRIMRMRTQPMILDVENLVFPWKAPRKESAQWKKSSRHH